MLKWLIRSRLNKYERTYGYDTGYLRDVLAADVAAFFKFARVSGLSAYRKDLPREVAYAAKLVGTLVEDCGPCTQLMVTMAEREGVEAGVLAAILRGELDALPDDVRLGVRFARASLARDPAADELREEVRRRWGPRGLVSFAFALTASRLFPTLKYALGHGHACQRVMVAGAPVAMPVALIEAR